MYSKYDSTAPQNPWVQLTFGLRPAIPSSALIVLLLLANGPRLMAQTDGLPPFWKSRVTDVKLAVQQLRKGQVQVLTQSAGGRDVYLVTYGEKADWHSTANFSSATGGRDPASYALKDGTQRPVLFLLGPVHGQEFEGIVGLVNLLNVAETGRDLRGRDWKELAENIHKCRVLIVPVGNPDGRERCGFDSWVGEEYPTHERVGMGVGTDGRNLTWPSVKRFHPMGGPGVATLGAYWNDDAINLMHDEWFAPMAQETQAWFKIAREEAPDFIVSLHSHAVNPSIEPTAYVPHSVKLSIQQIGDRVQKRYAEHGLPHGAGGPTPTVDGESFPAPSFNLTSALHHACGAVSFVYETPSGLATQPFPQVTHDQLLDLQLLFFDELFRFATEHSVNWVTVRD